MKMSRTAWIHIFLTAIVALVALFFVLRNAGGVISSLGSELPPLSREA